LLVVSMETNLGSMEPGVKHPVASPRLKETD
jgi:hypothetical protein